VLRAIISLPRGSEKRLRTKAGAEQRIISAGFATLPATIALLRRRSGASIAIGDEAEDCRQCGEIGNYSIRCACMTNHDQVTMGVRRIGELGIVSPA
jgi:hypothetical protein